MDIHQLPVTRPRKSPMAKRLSIGRATAELGKAATTASLRLLGLVLKNTKNNDEKMVKTREFCWGVENYDFRIIDDIKHFL